MKKNDPRLIVTLEAASITAERAWNRPDNQDRCLPASESVLDISSRESTPAPEQHGSRIQLTFDDKPKNLEKGFVFGSDPQICDFFLGERGAGFSRRHFRISFSERGEVIFENTSREVAQVDYNGEDPPVRNHFTWILFDKYKHIVVTMKDEEEEKEDGLVFKVEWPNNKSCKAEYEAHRDAYLEERRNAFPALGQLGMKSQLTTARNTAQHSPGRHPQHSPRQHSPGQQPIYLMEEELGRGSFGTVHTAVDVSTGVVYAAKKFHSGNWKQEVDILKSVSHEHIVKFVYSSEEQKPLLVMEYLPLGNLACQGYITEEQNLQILCQGLQALDYLHSHSPPLAHRDIKPGNILVQSRIPFLIKLVDFGLAKHDSVLKTFCGTNEYAAPEIWDRSRYTTMVDIWSLGVVVFEYGYGLPKPRRKRKGSQWCQDIVKAADEEEGQGDALIDLISTKMLTMDYRRRRSASDCLEEVYRLGFYATQNVEIGRTTPTGNTTAQDGITRTRSVIAQPLQHAPSDRDVSSGFYDIGGASETTEIAPSKRDLREGVHFHNRASPPSLGRRSQGPTQIWNPQPEDKATATLDKRRRPQSQSPTADALGRGQSKRSRAVVTFETCKDPSNSRNSGQGSEQITRKINITRKGSKLAAQPPRPKPQLNPSKGPLATDVASLTHPVKPAPRMPRTTGRAGQKSARNRTRSPWERSSSPAGEVSLREIGMPSSKRNIHDNVRAMLAGNLDGENEDQAKITDFDGRHVQIKIGDKIVLMRREDCFLNATQILTLANKNSSEIEHLLQLMGQSIKVEVLPPLAGIPSPCSWVNFEHRQILCRHFGLEQELQPLINHGLKLQRNDYSKPTQYVNNHPTKELSRFSMLHTLPQPVTVRRSDLRIRANDICRASGQPNSEVKNIRREFQGSSDVVLGDYNHRGTYVDFWVGVELCRRYGLSKLEEELRTWKDVPQEPELSEFIEIKGLRSPVVVQRSNLRINASHIAKLAGISGYSVVTIRKSLSSEAFEILRGKHQGTYVNFDVGIGLCRKYQLPELEEQLHSLKRTSEEPSHVGPPLQESDRVLARNEGTRFRGTANRETPPASPGRPITNGPMQAEDAHGMDPGSVVAGLGGSVTPRAPCSIRRNPQSVPSIRCAKEAASSRQSRPDTGHSLLKPADRHLPSAKSVRYEVWNSQPQLSELTEVTPDLRPPVRGADSHYGSFSDLFVPV